MKTQVLHYTKALFLLVGCLALILIVTGTGCARTTIPLTNIAMPMKMDSVREIFGSYREGNFQNRSWPDAFQAMHQKLSREYPFTEWKGIDWEGLYDQFYPEVEAAEAAQDERAWYLALRRYLYSIPDGYIHITTPDAFRNEAIGGGYGFSVLRLDDGRLIVARIDPNGFAAMAGLKWGAEIISWNDLPPKEALDKTSLLWSNSPPATDEYRLFEQCALLTRAPVGAEVSIKFRNPGSSTLWVSRLQARSDQYKTLEDLTRHERTFNEFDSPLEIKILEGNIGYIKIYCQAATLSMPFPARAFRKAMDRFLQAKVNGIVLDLRGNTGGLDDLASNFAGHFTDKPLFFRNVVAFDYTKGGFALQEDGQQIIEPRTPYFSGPVVVLIHRSTRNNGQALASSLQELPQVITMGIAGTEGSWALPGGEISMPQGYVISYPIGRMLDASNNIRVTSGADMKSRLDPAIRIPLTYEGCDAFFNQGWDSALEKATAEIKARTVKK